MNNWIVKISSVVLSVFLIIYVAVQLAAMTRKGFQTQIVYEQSVVQSVPIQGVFVREEIPIPIDSAGRVVSPLYSVGTKVPIHSELGSIYQDMSAVRAQYRAQNIQTILTSLQKAQDAVSGEDVIRPETLNGQLMADTAQLAAMRDGQELSGISELKGRILEVMAKRAMVLEGVSDYNERITQLTEVLNDLQSIASSQIQTFTSTAAGYFVDHVDGLEETMTREYLDSMSASDLQSWLAAYPGYQGSQSAVKIVSSHRWIFAAVVNEEQMQILSNISWVTLRFPGIQDEVSARLVSSEREPETGLYKILLEGDRVSESLLSSRVLTADVVIQEYEGIKIPKEAIRFVESKPGVYVQNGNKIHFRYIDQIYETTDYVLSRSYYQNGEAGEDYVKLYDTVVVKGKGLYDEMLLH